MQEHVWNVHFKNSYFETVFSCMCCDFHTSFSWITLKMRIITSGGLCCFSRSPTPQLAWIASFSASVEQRGSTGQHSFGTLLFLGVAKRWLPGCSATTKMLDFCTCFQDNWHLKGQGAALVSDCLPLTSTLLVLQNCLVQPVTVSLFTSEGLLNQNKCKLPANYPFTMKQQGGQSRHFKSRMDEYWWRKQPKMGIVENEKACHHSVEKLNN